ncbi:MAG TPA: NAD(P)-binding domain-containing protein [Thermoleophilaceae bacterium]|nr:NAD(P)-binding domain-containing protein [Thermoleophilaceae bacterium]
MTQLPSACIIGAGSSGITAAKALHERGVPFDLLEMSDRVGGNWAIDNPNGLSSAYRSLHIDTSRERMEYSDFPMPKSYPDFPKHTHIAEYFNAYVDHFGLRERILFETRVECAERRSDGVWEVALSGPAGPQTRRYDALLVANGHHWDPRWPEPYFPGSFGGVEMHSHFYRDPDDFKGSRIVVVGMGNSAMDIAVESSYVAEKVFLAARRGAHVIPKYIFGRPIDQIAISPHIPFPVRRRIFEGLLRAYQGKMEQYGLPKPDHRLGDAHPTISADLLSRVAHGEVTPKPNVERLEGDRVRFTDGSVEEADVVVYCTGYKVTFPFFDEGFISAPDNDLPLFKRTFHQEIDNVFFVGLMQPVGAIMPIAERQGVWIADYLIGRYALPATGEVRVDIERERRRMFKRYVASKRHTMQVDYDDFMLDLEREMKRGHARAVERGRPLGVEPRAARPEGAAAT